MKFLVPNYSCLQNPWLGGLPPPDLSSLCPLSSPEFVEPPQEQNSWVRHWHIPHVCLYPWLASTLSTSAISYFHLWPVGLYRIFPHYLWRLWQKNKRLSKNMRHYQKTLKENLKEWITTDSRNTPSNIHPGDEEIADAPGKDGNASMPEQVKRPNPWRKIMMMMMMMTIYIIIFIFIWFMILLFIYSFIY